MLFVNKATAHSKPKRIVHWVFAQMYVDVHTENTSNVVCSVFSLVFLFFFTFWGFVVLHYMVLVLFSVDAIDGHVDVDVVVRYFDFSF